jgi:hypothetical protein
MTRRDPAPALGPLAERTAYAGLAPLVAALAAAALVPQPEQRELALRAALAWGAVVLSFVGAVHWGLAVARQWAWSPAVVLGSIGPALAAAVALLLGGQRGLATLVAGFGLFWLYEHRRRSAELPPDYVALRRNLTLLVCGLLVLTMLVGERAGVG